MNENAKKWVAALRSGEYLQARTHLRREYGFCCLGVACDLYAKSHPEADWERRGNLFRFMGELGTLPNPVRKWIGLTDSCGIYNFSHFLVTDNDEGKSFNEIADIIESEPAYLFEDSAQ
jgi:hypothetical protein